MVRISRTGNPHQAQSWNLQAAATCSTMQAKYSAYILQVSSVSEGPASLEEDTEDAARQTSQEHRTEEDELSHTQAALRHAVQQLEELTGSDDDMHDVHAQLKQQTQALHSMQESFASFEEEKAREHEQTLNR